MKIALTYIHYPVSAPKFIKRALRDLGHEVVSIGPFTNGYLPWLPVEDLIQYADVPDLDISQQVIHNKFYQVGSDILPAVDLVIQCDANFFVMGLIKCPNVVWAIDNHVKAYNEREFDWYFGAHSWGYQGKHFMWLPCAYDPHEHYNENIERTLNAVMVGAPYSKRIELIKFLGQGINGVLGVAGLIGNEYRRAYNSAKVSIVSAARNDLAMRVFESANMGCVLLSEPCADYEKIGLIENQNYVMYNTHEEARDKLRWLLEDERAYNRIREASMEWVKPHTWANRCEKLLKIVYG